MSKNEPAVEAFIRLLDTINTLRGPAGCPWDREQTPASMREYLLEEAYEAVEAITENDADHVREELGDVLLILTMITAMYAEAGEFTITQVVQDLVAKLIRRHPHVFGDVEVSGVEEVLHNWRRAKSELEGRDGSGDSIFAGIPSNLPPLERACKLQKKAAARGWDEADTKASIITALSAARGHEGNAEEYIGGILFALVNYSRQLGVNPALALLHSNASFEKQFEKVKRA